MPFTPERNKQKYLMAVLGLAIVLIIFVVWQGFLKKGEGAPAEPVVFPPFKKVKIDWELLENPQIEELILFEEAPPYEEEIGRENPFIPY